MKIPFAFALGLLLSGCATYRTQGRLINLETGEEVLVDAQESADGPVVLKGSSEGGDTLRGELWEVRAFDAPTAGSATLPHDPGDTVYFGTGFLRGGSLVLDLQYHRLKESSTAVGTATDNRGGRYKAVFWRARKTKALKLRGP